MSIGNTIETDLIGELAEVYQRERPLGSLVARGRVRATTADNNGHMIVWLEIVDDHGASLARNYGGGRLMYRIGDVITIGLGTYDWSETSMFMRLLKENT